MESGTKDGVAVIQDQVLGKGERNISERQRCAFSASSVSSEPRGHLCFIKPVIERNDSWSAMLKLQSQIRARLTKFLLLKNKNSNGARHGVSSPHPGGQGQRILSSRPTWLS